MPDNKSRTGGNMGGKPQTAPQAPPASRQINAGDLMCCPLCGENFNVYPLPREPDKTRCSHCSAEVWINSLKRPTPNQSSDLYDPAYSNTLDGDLIDSSNNPLLGDIFSAPKSESVAQPGGVQVSGNATDWQIRASHGNLGGWLSGIGGFVFAIIFFAASKMLLPPGMAGQSQGDIFRWIPFIVLIVAIWQVWKTATGTTVLQVQGDQAVVEEGAWPLRRKQEFQWSAVQRVRAVDRTMMEETTDSDMRTTTQAKRYTFLQLLGPEPAIVLAQGITGHKFLWLRDELRRRLQR